MRNVYKYSTVSTGQQIVGIEQRWAKFHPEGRTKQHLPSLAGRIQQKNLIY